MIAFFLIVTYYYRFKYHKSLLAGSFFAAFFAETKNLLSHSVCPDCLDNELCKPLENGRIHLHWMSRIVAVFHPHYTKSVFFAWSDDLGDIVLKSVTRRNTTVCSKSESYKSSKNITESVFQDNLFVSDDIIQNVVFCPNIKSFDQLLSVVDNNLTNLANTRNLWLDLQISIEPILFKFLSQVPKINVPKFYGACGDLTFTEYKGRPLYNYFASNWMLRIFLSFQLLEMADTFTFYHPTLIFYLTDISPDNIVVNSSGIISLIDLDNVIISERMGYQNYSNENEIHVSKVIDPMHMSTSPSEICDHALSDHNFYGVCRYILMDTGSLHSGLLNDIPKSILKQYPNLMSLLQECGKPEKFPNRIYAGKQLKKKLEKIVAKFSSDKDF